MLLSKKFSRAACACGLILAMSFAAFADTIRLKDGSVIKGKITNFGNGKFTVVVGDGTNRRRELNYAAAEVESISFDSYSAATTVPANKNPTIINAGQTSGAPKINQSAPVNSNSTTNANPPITLSVSVFADNTSNGWTDSKFVVRKGQRIRITGAGQISLGGGNYAAPRGIASLADPNKLIAQSPTGALIAVIGDDNNDFIFIGAQREFVATRDGALFLGVNEGNLNDNSGKFDVRIEIQDN